MMIRLRLQGERLVPYAVRHAPHNMDVGGKPFRGGEFIPADAMANASPAERAEVEGNSGGSPSHPQPGPKIESTPEILRKATTAASKFAGRPVDARELASWSGCGGDPRARVSVRYVENGVNGIVLSLDVDHPEYKMTRHCSLLSKTVDNDGFVAKKTGTGLGIRVFASQVNALVAAGFRSIATHAARSGPGRKRYNGYYTWARFGYDARFPDELRPSLPPELGNPEHVSDLMKTPEGREWWLKNGTGMKMKFDLTPGSQSRRVLADYLKARAAGASRSATSPPATTRSSTKSGTGSARRNAGESRPVRYEVRHAPHNMSIGGRSFKGGEFIPDEAYEAGTPFEKASVDYYIAKDKATKAGLPWPPQRAGAQASPGTNAATPPPTEQQHAPGSHPGTPAGHQVPDVVVRDNFKGKMVAAACRACSKYFGYDVAPEEIAGWAGANDGADVKIADVSKGSYYWMIGVEVYGPDDAYICEREIHIPIPGAEHSSMKPYIYNSIFTAENKGQGEGTALFGRQVAMAKAAGFGKLKCYAAGQDGGSFNGYYTWARFGYDAPLYASQVRAIPSHLLADAIDPDEPRVSDLMATPEGRAWWKKNGDGMDMEFDLSDNSTSMNVWNDYLTDRVLQGKRVYRRAPAGGLHADEKHFRGGQFTPSNPVHTSASVLDFAALFAWAIRENNNRHRAARLRKCLVVRGGKLRIKYDGQGPVRYAAVHAPHNMMVSGKQFHGGEFIPGNVVAAASPQEKATLGVGTSNVLAMQSPGKSPQQPREPDYGGFHGGYNDDYGDGDEGYTAEDSDLTDVEPMPPAPRPPKAPSGPKPPRQIQPTQTSAGAEAVKKAREAYEDRGSSYGDDEDEFGNYIGDDEFGTDGDHDDDRHDFHELDFQGHDFDGEKPVHPWTEHHDAIMKSMDNAIKNASTEYEHDDKSLSGTNVHGRPTISPRQRESYGKSVKDVVSRIPGGSAKHIAGSLDSVTFHGSLEDIRKDFNGPGYPLAFATHETTIDTDDLDFSSDNAGKSFATKKVVSLTLDGGIGGGSFTTDPKGDASSQQDIYAHEIGHVVDSHFRFSSTPEWFNVWHEEIAPVAEDYNDPEAVEDSVGSFRTSKLSQYAATSAAEGFAEVFRLVCADPSHKLLAEHLPRTHEYLKKQGLLD